MSNIFEFVAIKREKSGTGAARGVRRGGSVPAVLYGGGGTVQLLSLITMKLLSILIMRRFIPMF